MTFDVGELPGRARELAQAQDEAAKSSFSPKAGYAPGYAVPEDEMLSVYDDFLDIPAPEDFGTMTDNLLEAMRMLATEGFSSTKDGEDPKHPELQLANNDLTGVSTAGIEVEDWTGDAADSFFTNYGQNFSPTASSQFSAYYMLRHAVNAEAAVWQTVRDDLDKLSANATEQMRHVTDSNQDDWTAALSVAGAVVAVGGAIPTAGASLAGWTVVGAGVTVASTGMGLATAAGGKDEMGLANGTPKEIVSELKRALGEIKKKITAGEKDIHGAVSSAVDTIDGGWKKFCLPRPALADAPRGGLYDHANMGGV